ncbi:hypothetical protein SAMN04487944_11581 [Gracilibacillus ureilyticus]|uniref:DUF5044 domain-containing protein n=1 Tax=Gracilibacillus ureilyticus TaxID=531814 RepID=A0A1H9TZP1_9BACI|nr:hypothetical protein [Gracilibacillus ureilyticus]SES02468.1 hypothetical protein SAMN04487944_11581 [Gracilibacillus ureilyticus]
MNREKMKAVIEWAIAFLLIILVMINSPYYNYYELSPESAFEKSERTLYYGPSEVVEKVDLNDVQIFLGKYKSWFSATLVNRHAGIFWGPGSGVTGMEIEEDKDISHSWGSTSINEDFMLMRVYGIVTNPDIYKVELDVAEGYSWDKQVPAEDIVTLTYPLVDHRMFLFYWNEMEHDYLSIALRGLGSDGEVIYEEDLR